MHDTEPFNKNNNKTGTCRGSYWEPLLGLWDQGITVGDGRHKATDTEVDSLFVSHAHRDSLFQQWHYSKEYTQTKNNTSYLIHFKGKCCKIEGESLNHSFQQHFSSHAGSKDSNVDLSVGLDGLKRGKHFEVSTELRKQTSCQVL